MKLLLITLLLSIGQAAVAQTSSLKTRISDDDKTLSIQIDGFKNGRKIHVNQAFDVVNTNALQKELLKYRTYDSVGLTVPLHEVQWLLILVFGLPALIITLCIMNYQARKAALLKPETGSRIE